MVSPKVPCALSMDAADLGQVPHLSSSAERLNCRAAIGGHISVLREIKEDMKPKVKGPHGRIA